MAEVQEDQFEETAREAEIRAGVRAICRQFQDEYWRELDVEREYPVAFVQAMSEAGWLSALIPQEYGGLGLTLSETAIILEEVNRQGGNAGPAHAQVYIMGALVRHGSKEQKQRYLPEIASGRLRLQAFAVTEPEAGSDTSRITTTAVRDGDLYLISGRKIYISRVQHSDLMLLLARTAARDAQKPTAGLSLFLVDLREAGDHLRLRRLRMLMNNETNEVEIDQLPVAAENLIGQEHNGFRQIVDGWNAERILIAAECIGDGRWFVNRGAAYASRRRVFDRPLGANQSIQFPLAAAHAQIEAADLVRRRASARFDAGRSCGPDANMAKYLASEASWAAANACLDAHGGNGFNAEYDIERKLRETRLYRTAPISNNLVLAYLARHVLGMPRSY
jgi:acyl-CoA dehydrogenase